MNLKLCFMFSETCREATLMLGKVERRGEKRLLGKHICPEMGDTKRPLLETPSSAFLHLLLPARPSVCFSPVLYSSGNPVPHTCLTPPRLSGASTPHLSTQSKTSSSTSIFFILCSPHCPCLAYIFTHCSNLFIPSFLLHCVDTSGPVYVSAQL